MVANYSPAKRTLHAITDLYDENRSAFLVQYPTWFIVSLGMGGMLAIAVTGLTGYSKSEPFSQPWLLFLWLCALLVTLQLSIFRHPSLRRQLIAVLAVSCVAIVVIGIVYFNASLPAFPRQQLSSGSIFPALATNRWTYTVINFGVIGVFWLDNVRRWIRRSRGLPPNSRVSLGGESGIGTDDLPSLQELIAGDLLSAGILTLLLSGLFQPQIISLFVHPTGVAINTCTISWPVGPCTIPGAGSSHPPTLSFIDLIQTGLYLLLGLLILSLSATLSGISAVGGVNETYYDESRYMLQRDSSSGSESVAADVTATVIATLRTALNRRVRVFATNLALTVRIIAWPSLIVLAVAALARLSSNIQVYLHSAKTLSNVVSYGVPSLAWGICAALAAVFSASFMVFRWRVVSNTLRFMGLIGIIFVLVFWIFSFVLAGVNFLLTAVQITDRSPFFPPGTFTFGSLALLVVFGMTLLVRRSRTLEETRVERTGAVLQDKEQANDFDVLLLYDKQDAAYMRSRVVKSLQDRLILPFQGEIGAAALPPVDQVRSAVICLGKHGAAFTLRHDVTDLLKEMANLQIPVAVAMFAGFRGDVPAVLSTLPQVDLTQARADVVSGLEPIVGKAPEGSYTFRDRVETVRRGLVDDAPLSHPDFALALLSLMEIRELKPVATRDFDRGAVWTGTLPHMGLQLPTEQMTIFLRADEQARNYQAVLDRRPKDGAVLVIDIKDLKRPAAFRALAPVWIRLSDIHELLWMTRANLTRSVKRLITQQINEVLYPYKTHGVGTLFFGRERELTKLSSEYSHGGIIIGAHHSGKTNLLHKLKAELASRRRVVVGPMSSTSLPEFFDTVQRALESVPQGRGMGITHLLGRDGLLSIDNFDGTLRRLNEQVGRISFLLDEVDTLLDADRANDKRLTRILRSLTFDEQADFYLAGHSRLRNAIAEEENPLRNFATEVILTGLDEPAALGLIQQPMEQLGYSVTTEQARRIYRGTAGAAWLLQHFCLSLLHLGENHIEDSMIERIEQDASYLQTVWDFYEYGLDVTSLAILMLTALQPDITRRGLIEGFAAHSVELRPTVLDEHLEFLVKFGVLDENPPGSYHVLARYLQPAIMARDPEALAADYLKKIRRESA